MKKIFMLTCAVMVSLALSFQAYCAEQAINTGKKSLIIYYSLSGNTKTVVNILQELVGAEAMEIKSVRPYPDDLFRLSHLGKYHSSAHGGFFIPK